MPLPSECTSVDTLNLTESWRNYYNGTDLKNDDRKIFVAGKTWFRFSGAAGNLLRNTCPLSTYSCGSTSGAYWSNSPLPTNIGETVSITFYEKLNEKCNDNGGRQIRKATRCTADRGDVVYRLDVAIDGSYDTVCGMD